MQDSRFDLIKDVKDIKDEEWDPLFVWSFKGLTDQPAIAIRFPGGLDPAYRTANVDMLRQSLSSGTMERANAFAKDKVNGDIVSFIACRVYKGPLGIIDGELAQPPPPAQLPQIEDEKDRKFYEKSLTTSQAIAREIKELHVPLLFVQVLATDPTRQRQGAASTLLQWAIQLAVEAKLKRLALTASQFTVKIGFYEKFGFYVAHKHTFVDKEQFPDREIRSVWMIKDL